MFVPRIHDAFLNEKIITTIAQSQDFTRESETPAETATLLTGAAEVNETLSILLPLLTRIPPTSPLIDALITPIISQLFALHVFLSCDPTADETTKRELKDILRAWGRLVPEESCIQGLRKILRSGKGWGEPNDQGKQVYWGRDWDGDDVAGLAVVFGRYVVSLHASFLPSMTPGVGSPSCFVADVLNMNTMLCHLQAS